MKPQTISRYAAVLGRLGGLVRSRAKTQAARKNGKRGGRPPQRGRKV